METTEIFTKCIYDEHYLISNMGNVYSLRQHKILKPAKHKQGYLVMALSTKLGKKTIMIHRLVAIHFLPNPHNKKEVNHINCNKSDNSIYNLEWVTPQENIRHAFANKCYPSRVGAKNSCAKLNDDKVKEIKEKLKSPYRGIMITLAKEYGVDPGVIYKIKAKKSWRHI
jgi:hypothetical protein